MNPFVGKGAAEAKGTMDNYALYSEDWTELPVNQISGLAGKGKFSVERSGNRVTAYVYTWPDLKVTLNVMPTLALKKHLIGFAGYVWSLYEARGEKPPPKLIRRIKNTRLCLGCVVDPGMDDEERANEVLGAITYNTRSLMFCGDSLYDENAKLIIGPAEDDAAEEDEAEPSPEAVARKERSMARLKSEDVPVLETLPLIETAEESLRRTPQEVAERAMALAVVALKAAEGLEQEVVESLIQEFEIRKAFSPNEKAFIENPAPTEHDRIQFAWRYECLWVLLWSLGYVEELSRPESVCDVPRAVATVRDRGRDAFVSEARFRSQMELLDAADLIYRYHWAVVDARVYERETPAGLDGGVVLERHYALNWLIGYENAEWDDVSTDT